MYKRLKPGEFIAMTPEQQKAHKRALNKRWRDAHPDIMHEQNLHWYRFYKKVKPHTCICKKCGQSFNAPRAYFKLCDGCRNKDWGGVRRQAILDRQNARLRKHEQVIELAKQGLFQI